MNNLNLTEEQVNDLLYENNVYNENDEILFAFIEKKYRSHDREKSIVSFLVTIRDVKTGIKYRAELSESSWYLQEEYNAKKTWEKI